jgi:hypothetical protein
LRSPKYYNRRNISNSTRLITPDQDIAEASDDLEEFKDFQNDYSAKSHDINAIFGTFTSENYMFHFSEISTCEPSQANFLIVQCLIDCRDNRHSLFYVRLKHFRKLACSEKA